MFTSSPRRFIPFGIGSMLLALATASAVTAQPGGDDDMINAPDHPLLQGYEWRSIGPAGQGGRVDDIAVHPENIAVYYAGFATGGLWKTTNQGITFEPIFDTYGTHSIGDIAIAPSNPEIVYVGTGEPNNRQSSSFGDGMYKTTDGGETFTHIGLRETQTIARVRVHPTDADVVWVAAVGRLFGPSEERGVFKSTDGGSTWTKTLYVDENTGATDLVIKPGDPNTLYAATYQRRRSACCFHGGGPGSGIWKSTDGGDTWTRLEGNGLPEGTKGRIALAVTPADPEVVYAQIEVAADAAEPITDEEFEEREDAGEFDVDPNWAGIWRSTDDGDSWEIRSNENGRPMYFSQIRVSPEDVDLVYVVDQRVHKSTDGGVEFDQLSGYGHVDQHAFWINPENHDHLITGNDGGLDVSYDQGESWRSIRHWAVGQPYHASVDMRRPYYVCTGLQDNGSWCGPSHSREGDILAEDWYGVGGGDGFYTAVDPTDYTIIFSESQNGNINRLNLREGDGGGIEPEEPDEDDPLDTNIMPPPSPDLDIRWHWNTPFILSPHNPRTIHAGGNRLFTSRDRGETWTMSPDLTKNVDRDTMVVMGLPNGTEECEQDENRGQPCILSHNDGVSDWSTIASVSESAIIPGLLWVGTDDGNIQVRRSDDAQWTEVSRNLPGGTTTYYVSRVEASHHDPATAYASIDGHRSGDMRPYVYVTRDYGQTWTSIASNLPEYGNVNTIRQDPNNPDLLYVGTEFGFFISLDEGGTWHRFMPNLPVVRIDDVVVHPRENDLVLATHGRSIWILDDITGLQGLTDEVRARPVHLFEPREAVLWKEDIRLDRETAGDQVWEGEPAPDGTAIHYYLRDAVPSAELRIEDPITNEVLRIFEAPVEAGIHRIRWNLEANPEDPEDDDGYTVDTGRYRVVLEVAGVEHTAVARVVEDIWMIF